METVTIRHQDQYTMPKVCCACGEPVGLGRLLVSGASRGGTQLVNFSFPLCDGCAQLAETVNRRRRTARWVGLGVVLFLSLVVAVVAYASDAVLGFSFFTFLSGLIFLIPAVLLGVGIAQWLASNVSLDRQVSQSFRRVAKAVRVNRFDVDTWGKKGYVTFTFANDQFADLFQEMNTGVVLPGKLDEIGGG